jgi:hypothetical protein
MVTIIITVLVILVITVNPVLACMVRRIVVTVLYDSSRNKIGVSMVEDSSFIAYIRPALGWLRLCIVVDGQPGLVQQI